MTSGEATGQTLKTGGLAAAIALFCFCATAYGRVTAGGAQSDPDDRLLFDAPWIGYGTGNFIPITHPQHTTVADFNGDDDPDLAIVTSKGLPRLSVLFGDGLGGFGLTSAYSIDVESRGVTAIDFDLDGDLDLAISNTGQVFEGDSITIWENHGAGAFTEFDSFPISATGPAQIVAADFDGDGWIDLATANDADTVCNNTVSILHNQAGNGFIAADVLSIGHCPHAIDAGDVNGDGFIDLVVGHRNNRWSVLMNDGNGGLTDIGAIEGITSAPNPNEPTVHLVDVDLDDDLDVLYSQRGSGGLDAGAIGLWRNDGDGGFASPEILSFDWPNRGGIDIASGDVSGDGWPDVLTVTGDEGTWFLFRSDGAGGFHPAERFRAGQRPSEVLLADLDRDGDLDPIIIARLSVEACVYRNPGDGSFAQPPVMDFCDPSLLRAGAGNLQAGDVDGDGDLDLVLGFTSEASNAHGLTVRSNNGDGSFGPRETYDEPMPVVWQELEDLDADGDLDLVYLDADANFCVRWNDGSGAFGAREVKRRFAESGYGSEIRAADMDNDGDLDIGVNVGTSFLAAENLGRREFGKPYVAATFNVTPRTFGFVDADLNGHIDLVADGGRLGSFISLSYGAGNGHFGTPFKEGMVEPDVRSIGLGNVVSDLTVDLVAVHDNDRHNISVSVGTMTGFGNRAGYGGAPQFGENTRGGSVVIVDVNDDDLNEVLTANLQSQDVSFWVNLGDSELAPVVRLGAGHRVNDLAAADFDGDGRIDLALAAEVDDGDSYHAGVVMLRGVPPKVGEPMEAPLTAFDVTFGSLLQGGLNELQESDDAYLRARSQFGFSAQEPNVIELFTRFLSPKLDPFLMDLSFELRINHPNGLGVVNVRKWGMNQYTEVASFPIGLSEEVHEIPEIIAVNYVHPTNGRIEVRTRLVVAATFSAMGFDAWFDRTAAQVR